VIFACVHNAGRSQMAAAWFNRLADPARARAESAGTQPAAAVHPVVVDVMNEIGVSLQGVTPRTLTPALAQGATLLVTMGCGEDCPFVPGVERDDWPLADPKERPLAEVRQIRDAIRVRVSTLIKARGWGGAARAHAGLCADCLHARLVRPASGSVYYWCGRSTDDPSFPKYPPLPVVQCEGYTADRKE
jgi:arsenate reductase